jgi:amino-acid N-acetyltransferase
LNTKHTESQHHVGGSLPEGIVIRQALPSDAQAIHALMRPYVMQRLLLSRTEAEVIELTRHGFVAVRMDSQREVQLVGFSAVEIYSPKLAELQCLAVHAQFQGSGIGRALVGRCVERARALNVMEVMAISSSENFLKGCGFDYALPDQKKALFCQLRSRNHE